MSKAAQHLPPVIAARDISLSFGGHRVFRDVSVELRPGQVVVLRGENGSGKTTLLNLLTGNLEPVRGELRISLAGVRRSYSWPAPWWRRMSPLGHFAPERLASAGVARVWQDIRLFGTFTVLDNVTIASPDSPGENPIAALLRLGRVRTQEAANRERATRTLEGLGLGERLESSCDRLSLGQMKRAAIARVVQAGARVILLDEPLAGLDGAGQREVLEQIRRLAATGRYTLVVVEHVFNLPRVLELATDVWTLVEGRVELQSPTEVKGELRMDGARPENPLGWVEGVTTEPVAGGLEVEELVVRRGQRPVLDRYSHAVAGGALQPLIKPNGWGKTTLLDAIAGRIPVEGGQVLLDGRELTAAPSWRRSQLGISYLRSRDNVVPGLTVAEHETLSRGGQTLAQAFQEWQEFMPPAEKRAALLSGGERQRLALGCLPLGDLLLLDEPFLNLDQAAIGCLTQILRRTGRTTLIAAPSPGSVEPPF